MKKPASRPVPMFMHLRLSMHQDAGRADFRNSFVDMATKHLSVFALTSDKEAVKKVVVATRTNREHTQQHRQSTSHIKSQR